MYIYIFCFSSLLILKVTLSFAVFIMFLLLLIINYIAGTIVIILIREREVFMKSFLFLIQVIAHAYVHVL